MRLPAFAPLALILVAITLVLPPLSGAAWAAATPRGVGLGASAVAAAFGLLPPVRVAYCDEYPEDGTIGMALVDRRGAKLLCGIVDGRRGANIVSKRQPAARPKRVFVGATYPSRPGAKTLPLWGAKERSLLQLLAGAIADSISDAQNDFLLRSARAGDFSDPGGVDFLRLIGAVERRRRMLAAVSSGEVAPAGDAFEYFGFRGPLAVQRILLDRSGRLGSIAVSDTAGLGMTAVFVGTDARTGGAAWSVDLGEANRGLYVPLGGYEERYLLTVLSTALQRAGAAGSGALSPAVPGIDARLLKAAIGTIQKRKDQILKSDRSD